jgi:hypothetical protein
MARRWHRFGKGDWNLDFPETPLRMSLFPMGRAVEASGLLELLH